MQNVDNLICGKCFLTRACKRFETNEERERILFKLEKKDPLKELKKT